MRSAVPFTQNLKKLSKNGWPPEQVAGRMWLERQLPGYRRRRGPRGYRRHNRTHIFDTQILSHRPDRISERAEFGHWGCDLMMFCKEHGKVNVTSLIERVSRFAVVMRNEDRQSRRIMEVLIQGLAPLPADARQSITFIAVPSSQLGGPSRPGSVRMRGFATRKRRTRKEL